jgi:hypothetical protein
MITKRGMQNKNFFFSLLADSSNKKSVADCENHNNKVITAAVFLFLLNIYKLLFSVLKKSG